jgi:hypothetical protein
VPKEEKKARWGGEEMERWTWWPLKRIDLWVDIPAAVQLGGVSTPFTDRRRLLIGGDRHLRETENNGN